MHVYDVEPSRQILDGRMVAAQCGIPVIIGVGVGVMVGVGLFSEAPLLQVVQVKVGVGLAVVAMGLELTGLIVITSIGLSVESL